MNYSSLQQQTLVRLVMAVRMFALKEAIAKQHAPALLITSWRVMERLAKVLANLILL